MRGKKKGGQVAYVLLLRLLDEKGFSVVAQLHVQVDWLSVHFNVNLEEDNLSTQTKLLHWKSFIYSWMTDCVC